MPFCLNQVVPWGRSFDEYCRMFALHDVDLQRSILGCADGPAAFNARLTQRGGSVVSCDPLYQFSQAEIETRIRECLPTILEQARANAHAFVWANEIPDLDALELVRMAAMREFLADFPAGKDTGRYVVAELPVLPFGDGQFELALCSHFLFLYGTLSADFHRQALRELVRVATEVRVFPLRQLDGLRSPHLPELIDDQAARGHRVEVVEVAYEFQRGAKEMVRIRRGDA